MLLLDWAACGQNPSESAVEEHAAPAVVASEGELVRALGAAELGYAFVNVGLVRQALDADGQRVEALRDSVGRAASTDRGDTGPADLTLTCDEGFADLAGAQARTRIDSAALNGGSLPVRLPLGLHAGAAEILLPLPDLTLAGLGLPSDGHLRRGTGPFTANRLLDRAAARLDADGALLDEADRALEAALAASMPALAGVSRACQGSPAFEVAHARARVGAEVARRLGATSGEVDARLAAMGALVTHAQAPGTALDRVLDDASALDRALLDLGALAEGTSFDGHRIATGSGGWPAALPAPVEETGIVGTMVTYPDWTVAGLGIAGLSLTSPDGAAHARDAIGAARSQVARDRAGLESAGELLTRAAEAALDRCS